MEAYWGSGSIVPHILGLGTRWRWVVSFTSRPLYPKGKNPWYPLGGWLGPRTALDIMVKRKIPNPMPGLEPPIIQTVAHWAIRLLFCYSKGTEIKKCLSWNFSTISVSFSAYSVKGGSALLHSCINYLWCHYWCSCHCRTWTETHHSVKQQLVWKLKPSRQTSP